MTRAKALIEVEVAPGGGNDPHYHKTYNEHFEVLEGTLEVLVGEETLTLGPGQRAVAKKNALHRFRNTTEERAKPPRVVQKVLFAILAPVARLLGYRGSYPEYLERGPTERVEASSLRS